MDAGTERKTSSSTAPPARRRGPRSIHGEKTSPRRSRAKNAFQRRETAPRGARITTGREAIWNTEPKRFEERNMAVKDEDVTAANGRPGTRTKAEKP